MFVVTAGNDCTPVGGGVVGIGAPEEEERKREVERGRWMEKTKRVGRGGDEGREEEEAICNIFKFFWKVALAF